MRLGGKIFVSFKNPEEWAVRVKEKGYSAAFCPIDNTAEDCVIEAYRIEAQKADIVIGEVGIWNNPIHPDETLRNQAIDFAKRQLELAEKIQASCCVNISGTWNRNCWYGNHENNFSEETFELVVKTVQEIIDAVNPKHTFYTLEPSPWLYPDSIDSYLQLMQAIDRKAFAVHWDAVNMMFSPKEYYRNGEFLKECIEKLGNYIKSCHVKDIYMDETFTLHMQEKMPGEGILDYQTLIRELNKLNPDMPVFLEHMETDQEYDKAAMYMQKLLKIYGK